MTGMGHRIISCRKSQLERLSSLFGHAFFIESLYKYFFPEVDSRTSQTAWELGNVVHYGLLFGEVQADMQLQGCAVWLPPGATDFIEERMPTRQKTGIGSALLQLGLSKVNEGRFPLYLETAESENLQSYRKF